MSEPEPPTAPLPDYLYTPAQAGQFLGMSERMMKRRLDTGAIGHVKSGRKRMIRGRQIVAYMDENEVDPLPPKQRPRLSDV